MWYFIILNSHEHSELSISERMKQKNQEHYLSFTFSEKGGMFQIKKNILCKYIKEMDSTPLFFKTQKDRYGKLVKNWEERSPDMKEEDIMTYSLGTISRRHTHVIYD